jgi:hypothetical protein
VAIKRKQCIERSRWVRSSDSSASVTQLQPHLNNAAKNGTHCGPCREANNHIPRRREQQKRHEYGLQRGGLLHAVAEHVEELVVGGCNCEGA